MLARARNPRVKEIIQAFLASLTMTKSTGEPELEGSQVLMITRSWIASIRPRMKKLVGLEFQLIHRMNHHQERRRQDSLLELMHIVVCMVSKATAPKAIQLK